MRSVTPVLLALSMLLTSCGTGLHDFDDSGDSGGEVNGEVVIHSIDPSWGPLEGGTIVTVSGEGFQGDFSVSFDDSPVEVFRSDDTTLLVTTPAWPIEDSVDVKVTSELGVAVSPDGFTYSDDGPVDPTGNVGGLVEFTVLQVACPDCFGYTQTDYVDAAAAFHPPFQGSWIGWMPAIGTCANNPTNNTPVSSYTDHGEWFYLVSGATSHSLHRTTGTLGPYYASNGLSETDYLRNAAWNLEGAFAITGAVHSVEGFTDIQPIDMLYGSPYGFTAVISRSGQQFTWQLTGIASRFVIIVEAYSADGSAYLGNVICVGPDSGSMVVPGANLGAYPSGSLLGIGLYRYEITESLLQDGSTLEGVSWAGVLGTGTLY